MDKLIVIFILLLQLLTATAQSSNPNQCPDYMQKPFNQSSLVGGEIVCQLTFDSNTCFGCCSNHNSVCCDNGSCMDFDRFCRYPETCCQEQYCGDQCCPRSQGTPCGPVCAPNTDYLCCNATSGALCAKPDTCCNGATCCPPSAHCCDSNICCDQGQDCCGKKCCPTDYKCCGDGNCCPADSDCFADGSCCPHGQSCANATNGCCSSGTQCSDDGNICCPTDQSACGQTCCHQGSVCCGGTCCLAAGGCDGDSCCPPLQTCGPNNCCPSGTSCCVNSPTQHCCPANMACCDDHCCPLGTHFCGENATCCPQDTLLCGDHCCDSGQACINDSFHTNYCCNQDQYCELTGKCCPQGFYCNDVGSCCQIGSTFCPGGSATACYSDPYNFCCPQQDGTACTANYNQCLSTNDMPKKDVCCPNGTNSVCGNICFPEDASNCTCCGSGAQGHCCYAPYTCQDDGTCVHSVQDHGHWHNSTQPDEGGVPSLPRAGRKSKQFIADSVDQSEIFLLTISHRRKSKEKNERHRKMSETHHFVNLPPSPTHQVDPASYPCFNDAITMNSTCNSWICLEEIANCGSTGYIDRLHQIYCIYFSNFANLFNALGQQCLTCTSNCVTIEHVQLFQHGFKPCCWSMQQWGAEPARNECILGCNFCSVYMSNVQGFTVLFSVMYPGQAAADIYSQLCGFE